MLNAAQLEIRGVNLAVQVLIKADSKIDCQDLEVVIRLIRKTILVVRYYV